MLAEGVEHRAIGRSGHRIISAPLALH